MGSVAPHRLPGLSGNYDPVRDGWTEKQGQATWLNSRHLWRHSFFLGPSTGMPPVESTGWIPPCRAARLVSCSTQGVMMLANNPFAFVSDFLPPLVMQVYLVLMTLAVVVGTLFDVYHKGSAKFYALRRKKTAAAAQLRLSSRKIVALAVETIAEAAVSGEFCKWPRRVSHLLMMYGFFLYLISTVVMVFAYPEVAHVPAILPALWAIGAWMILVGGLWFFFLLRVDVVHDGASPFHIGRADLFVGFLISSIAFAMAWQYAQATHDSPTVTWVLFGIYIFFTTLLFVTVPWSKFAHMFFKPAVAFQRRVEEANGSSDLPSPSTENYIVRS